MNILILMPKFPHMWWVKQPPIAALYTVSLLENEGHNVSFYDLRYEEEHGWRPQLQKMDLVIIQTAEYDLTQCYPWDLNDIKNTIEVIKEINPLLKIVAVGPHGKVAPKLTQEQLGVDGLLIGENETVIPRFVKKWSEFSEKKEKFTFTVEEQTVLDTLPIPKYDAVNLKKYKSFVPLNGEIEEVPTGLILANRGCPFACDYCYIGYFGKKVRYRPTDMVVDEIKAMYEKGIKNFFFLDYTFTVNKKWVRELISKLNELPLSDITWGCETRVDVIDESLIEEMAEVGCKYIWYGIESPDIKDMRVNKLLKREKIENILSNTVKHGIQPMAFMLVGFPDENVEEIINWCEKQPFIFDHSIVLPRPGTPLFERMGIDYDDYRDWNELAQNSYLKLESDRKKVEESFSSLRNMSNYFDNRLLNKVSE